MATSLIGEPIALGVLELQAAHLAKQALNLRFAIEKHGASDHLEAAKSYAHSAELLANYVRSCLSCEQDARAKLAQHLTEKDRAQAQEACDRG
jgi:hypothetical protein